MSLIPFEEGTDPVGQGQTVVADERPGDPNLEHKPGEHLELSRIEQAEAALVRFLS